MDQNVVRTDLLPESTAIWVLALMALVGVALWCFGHWALKRYCTNKFSVWARSGMCVPLGFIASWCVLQLLARFVFLATPWPLFVGAILSALAIEAVSAFYTHECARIPDRMARILVACRMAAVALVLLVLMQPVIIGERQRTVNRRIVLLVDDSESMHFPDNLMNDEEKATVCKALGFKEFPKDPLTRAEIVRKLLTQGEDKSFLKRLGARYTVDVFRFGNDFKRDESIEEEKPLTSQEKMFRSTTDLTAALEKALHEIPVEEVSRVIVFSDGRHNGPVGIEAVARRLSGYGIEVSSVLVGGTIPPFDIAVATADAPEFVFLGDKVRFTVRLTATQANGRKSKVVLYGPDDKVIDEQTFTVEGTNWEKEFKFTHIPETKGVYGYRIKTDVLKGERFESNNERHLEVSVSDDRTNVLLVDSRPRWEYRYLRNLFYGRDKSVHLQDWLITPDQIKGIPPYEHEYASAERAFGDSESGGFPRRRSDWRQFDVIIIGDVGEDILTPDVIENLRYCVEERGSLLVLIGGPNAMPYSIQNETLRSLMPIVYTPNSADHRESPEESFNIQLTAAGRGHLVMRQSSSFSENEEIWNGLPELHWRLPIQGVKPGAEVLSYAQSSVKDTNAASEAKPEGASAEQIAATIEEDPESALRRLEEMRNKQASHALMVASNCGKGHVLMMLTDEMWRLRSKTGDTRHHLFWGQVMRWGAGERLRAGNAHVRLGTDQLRYGSGEIVKAYARILDNSFTGIENLSPRFLLTGPDMKRPKAFYPTLRPDSNGFYSCEIDGCIKPGKYNIRLDCPKAAEMLGVNYPSRDLSTHFVVVTTKQPAEEVHLTATPTFLKRLADPTGGTVMTPAEFAVADNDYGRESKRLLDRVEYPLWCLPPLFILIVALLSTEWVLRKRATLS